MGDRWNLSALTRPSRCILLQSDQLWVARYDIVNLSESDREDVGWIDFLSRDVHKCNKLFLESNNRLEALVDEGDSRSSSRVREHGKFRLVSQLHVAIQTPWSRCLFPHVVWTNCRLFTSNGSLRSSASLSLSERSTDKLILSQPSKKRVSISKGPKRMVTKVQWLCWRRMSITTERFDLSWMLTHQIHDNWVAYSRIWSRRSLHRFYGRAQTYGKRSDV